MGRRVLITGIGSFWGGRVAAALEKDDDVEVIVGLGTNAPKLSLERTEYVRADQSYSILSRIVKATKVDTILHTFLVVDSSRASGARDQRHRHHEPARGGRRRGQLRPPCRDEVLEPGVRIVVEGPGVVQG